jgi:transcription initiation factor TFIIF subunit alpha
VAEEPGMKKLLTSDEDSDEEKSEKSDQESDEEKKKPEDAEKSKEGEVKTEKTKEKKKEDKKSKMQKFYDAINQKPGTGNASDFSSDSEDSEADPKAKKKKVKAEKSSRSGTPVDAKRKIEAVTNSSDNSNSPQSTPAKKFKTETPLATYGNFQTSKDSFGNTEEAVRRYLMRKPMTTTELLKKIQSKKTGVSRDELVDMMTQILKRINPSKQMVQGKMYLSLKAQ